MSPFVVHDQRRGPSEIRNVRSHGYEVAWFHVLYRDPARNEPCPPAALLAFISKHQEGMVRGCTDSPPTSLDLEDLFLTRGGLTDDACAHDPLGRFIQGEDLVPRSQFLDRPESIGRPHQGRAPQAFVLRTYAAEVVLLGFGDAELVPRRLDVLGHVVPGLHLVGGLDVVVDVVEVDTGEVSTPGRHRLAIERVERLVTELAHPVGLALAVAHHVDDLVRHTLLGLDVVAGGVVPSVLVGTLQRADIFVLLQNLQVLCLSCQEGSLLVNR